MKPDESTFLKVWTAKNGRKYHYSKFSNFILVTIQVMNAAELHFNMAMSCAMCGSQ